MKIILEFKLAICDVDAMSWRMDTIKTLGIILALAVIAGLIPPFVFPSSASIVTISLWWRGDRHGSIFKNAHKWP